MENVKLSQDFMLLEFVKSNIAIRNNLENIPNDYQVSNLINLVFHVLQPARSNLGIPIIINNGFRSLQLNKLINGAKTSQHLTGEAADIELAEENHKLFMFIKNNCDFDQLIWEYGDDENPDWVHVSYKKGINRKQVLRAIKENGKTKYIKF